VIRRLGVPLGTRLEMITHHPDGSWRIWTGIKSKQVPPEKYEGSYIEIHPDGHVEQWSGDEGFEVMEATDGS
jgi:hypothetical protein